MRIQIIAKKNSLACDEASIKSVESLWQKIKHDHSTEELTWTYAEEIDLISDVYIEVITAQKLKVGVLPATSNRIADQEIECRQFNDLHWITIEDHTSDQLNLISKFMLFIIGMAFMPSQMGHFMTDWADLRIALQYGNEAKYISSHELNAQSWSNSKTIKSSMLLLNEDLPMSKKLEIAAGLIPQSPVNKDYLAIMNITNSNHLPKTSMILLVYKN